MKGLLGILLVLASHHGFSRQVTDTTIRGISISFEYRNSIFPDFWQIAPINAEAEPIERAEIERCKTILKSALDKYPPLMLDKELKSFQPVCPSP